MSDSDIAVIGMAGRFPGAKNVSEYWRNLREGVESIRTYTDEELLAAAVDPVLLANPHYVKAGAPLAGVDMFDAPFFGLSPRDAAIMDPQHRHFLECVWEALEDAAYTPDRFEGSIGVFAGSGMTAYMAFNLLTNPELLRTVGLFLLRHTGNDKDFLATRASFQFNLKGPSVSVQTACSTSLVAIHVAMQSLLNGECDIALAGGVTIEIPHKQGYLYEEGEILAPDGHCRAFDHRSAGTVFGSGVGVVALRRLSDALEASDCIRAVIKGSAVNNDGSMKAGYLAPSVDGQAGSIIEALSIANVSADTITYVEAHGTGTPVGDPIEVKALTEAFRASTQRKGFCGIGSVKPNIGHLDTAAGVASFIKTVLALQHKQMPPSLHFEKPNPIIDFENSPFFVNGALRNWDVPANVPRRAGVSSLGVGGTNAHVILEEAPPLKVSSTAKTKPWQLLVLSARTETALDGATERLAHFCGDSQESLSDVAYTLQVGRKAFDVRRAVVASDAGDAQALLLSKAKDRVFTARKHEENPSLAFMFAGGGAQYPNMGLDLYVHEPVYKKVVDELLDKAQALLGTPLRPFLFPAPGEEEAAGAALEQKTSLQLPAIFITEYALTKLWALWGLEPDVMIGHSLGEYTAACVSGVTSVDDALRMVVLRGQLFEKLQPGGMLSVPLSEAELRPLLPRDADIAAVNAPEMCVASGSIEAMNELQQLLATREIECRRLRISIAAHSSMVDAILSDFSRGISEFRFSAPKIPFVSNVTGTWIRAEEATDPGYWVRHLRNTVRFTDGITEMSKHSGRAFLEVGPGRTLSSLAKAHPGVSISFATSRHSEDRASDLQCALSALGKLWTVGFEPRWESLHSREHSRRVSLPTYAFDHKRYWIEPGKSLYEGEKEHARIEKRSNIDEWFYQPVWVRRDIQIVDQTAEKWLVFREADSFSDAVVAHLRRKHQVITVEPGSAFVALPTGSYTLNPREQADYQALFDALKVSGGIPTRILHLWSLGSDGGGASQARLRFQFERSFQSVVFLARTIAEFEIEKGVRIGVVTSGAQRVGDEEAPHPEQALALGPCKVIPKEYPEIECVSIDIPALTRSWLGVSKAPISLAENVVAELGAPELDEVIALRPEGRFVQKHESIRVPSSQPVFRDHGVYLIAGGLGGIGLTMAEFLAKEYRASLILVSRSGLPDPAEWDAYVAVRPASQTSQRICKIRELQAVGSEIMIASCDVTDASALSEVIARAKQRFGGIHGVIHAAGALDDGLIQFKESDAMWNVIAPKAMGAIALDTTLQHEALDFFVMFSSTSSVLGSAGQVDYCAANLFLNAFARSRSALGKAGTLALQWGIWRDVGMTSPHRAKEASGLPSPKLGSVGSMSHHPWLGCKHVGVDEISFEVEYSNALWVFHEHRLASGLALMPGTGYVELARAALDEAVGSRTVEIRDLFFLAPLEVSEGARKLTRIHLSKQGNSYDFSVSSQEPGQTAWQEHARAVIGNVVADTIEPLVLREIQARCVCSRTEFEGDSSTKQERHLRFGPRWKNLKWIAYGEDEALAYLELRRDFESDLEEYALHPALLDLATGFPLPLLPGYESADDLFVPLSYGKIRMRGRLTRSIYSYARRSPGARATDAVVTFDILVTDEEGNVLVEIEKFAMKRVEDRAWLAVAKARSLDPMEYSTHGATLKSGNSAFDVLRSNGIAQEEGVQAFRRLMRGLYPPEVVVSSIDLSALVEHARPKTDAPLAHENKFARPDLKNEYEQPRDEIEEKLARIWQNALGVDKIGVHDDFFELGGQSLIAVRVFNQIKKTWNVTLPLSTLFQAPSISKCAEVLRGELGLNGDVPAVASSSSAPESRWSSLVPMQLEGAAAPFFCVAGMGGNPLNLRRLAALLGKERPFYGLQPPGLDGRQSRLERVEELSAHYVREIQAVQPHGPYFLGGYSGGGVAAFEMARQLVAQGETVSFLGFLDSFCPVLPRRTGFERGKIHAQRVFKQGPQYLVNTVSRRLAYQRSELMRRLYRPLGMWKPYEYRHELIEDSWLTAESHYRPGVFSGKATLFRAKIENSVSSWTAFRVDSQHGWAPYVQGGVEVHEVPGDHSSMCEEPHVQVLAALINECFVRASLTVQRDGETNDRESHSKNEPGYSVVAAG